MSTRARQFADSVSNLIQIASGDSTDFITPEILSASIAGVQEDIDNIDLSSAIISASSAAVDELDSRIVISSASPTLGNNDGRLWIDTSTASAPVVQSYGSGQFRNTRVSRIKAVGGNITQYGPYTIHTFNGSGNFQTFESLNVDYLVIAGGGGGGAGWYAGGGGAGGYRYFENYPVVSNSTVSVLVGSGGAGSTNTGVRGSNGQDSSFGLVASVGGGGGGSRNGSVAGTNAPRQGSSGGSGGGAAFPANNGGSGTSGQGNSGGNCVGGYGASGGGAGELGLDGTGSPYGVRGANGLQNLISGIATYYAGGGAAGTDNSATRIGGLGGGGDAARGTTVAATSGLVNTGGGGGGGSGSETDGTLFHSRGAAGGSGIVIIRYLT